MFQAGFPAVKFSEPARALKNFTRSKFVPKQIQN